MCGRYSFAIEDELIKERFGISIRSAVYKARYNCAPSQELAVISNAHPDELLCYRWGLIPFWAKTSSVGYKMINARAETIEERPAYRNAFRKHRCLIPADGFYEWRKNGEKVPYRIVLANGDPFAMAGIWEKWVSSDGEIIHSFSIITTEPNELMAPIHNRMPVILLPENEKMWLDETNEEALKGLLKPYPAKLMKAFPVSTLVNSPKNDSPAIIEPVNRES